MNDASPVWIVQVNGTAICRICDDGREREPKNCLRHENSDAHRTLLQHHQNKTTAEADWRINDDALRNLLSSFTRNEVGPYPAPHAPPPPSAISWNLLSDDADLPLAAEEQGVANIASAILQRYDDLPASDDEFYERSDDELDQQVPLEPIVSDAPTDSELGQSEGQSRKRTRTQAGEEATSKFWFPWPDRITCTLDILMHLPRSVFSQCQLDLFLWLLKVNQVDDVPSVKSMQSLNVALQKMCGIDTILYNGKPFWYFTLCEFLLTEVLVQEMANPKVRPHLSFYPEDSGPKLSEAHQGDRWLKELSDSQTTPMLRIAQQDYYIHEPAMLRNGECCIPTRWFTKNGQFFAKCWALRPVSTAELDGWRVLAKSEPYVVPATDFLKNFPEFRRDVESKFYDLPNPANIIDVYDETTSTTTQWTHTDPQVGNPWRVKADGCRVVTFPLWMYCDDTSGNVSKKWNEHNSFLVTPAGLPREESQKEYNIHFLCTSNIAPPLEMLDGIVDQLELKKHGVWAWDCELNEPVLLVPEVLALLGDNPMQRMDALDTDPEPGGNGHDGSVAGDDTSSVGGSDRSDVSEDSAGSKKGKKRKKVKETLGQMIQRVKNFVKIGRLRNKTETTNKLKSYFTEASTVDTKTKVQDQRTESGVKDTYQLFFLEKLFESYKGKRGRATKQAALDAQLAQLPTNTTSPVWRIKGLDPHQDTPVEILHVVLLGFVKYFWRDLIQLQLKNKDDKKELLITRLNSLDVSGLGISPLAGRTLVKYSGSLTGRDFRAIAQVAPFVIYDLVSCECFETWQALSKLIPLIWQPEIVDIDSHIALITKEIDNFLLHAARWTNRWFNKPKFHIILHLPAHIRRFGPAILFATEAFESFNAIIRAKSVHSNRHAPSRDIALAFAQGNRVRHLLSGGLFLLSRPSESDATPTPKFSKDPNSWQSIGTGPKHLVESPNTITSYLGLQEKHHPPYGVCTADKTDSRPIGETLVGQHIAEYASEAGMFRTCKDLTLNNGDVCVPGNFVIIQDPNRIGETFVGKVEEIIQRVGSVKMYASQSDGILIQQVTLLHHPARYGMPRVVASGRRQVYKTEDLLCTVNVQHN
ncbi:hypothetical protein MSAN_01354900 [Mycena sanguinolenta]|uniref:Uncharacterized protein n=1 Tax=Mycena sanguinolenta TaxID=230812 RepID=A0A8H6YAS4_9AGAR|nr:hypothetical protein MSAN_01354900 [Mycena sanguinolenta]